VRAGTSLGERCDLGVSRVFRDGYASTRSAGEQGAAPDERAVPAEASLQVVARWTGTWLSGPGASGTEDAGPPGSRLGLPPQGPGSLASTGARLVAVGVDILMGVLIGGLVVLFLGEVSPQQRGLANNAAFALQVVVLQALTGQSMGMRLLGIRVRRLEVDGPLGLLPALLRTALLVLLVPALIYDRDRRGLHDRAARTVVVRAR
jgi:uncharacterized RDD family membrane protein YckC